jgi:hypothetical protein
VKEFQYCFNIPLSKVLIPLFYQFHIIHGMFSLFIQKPLVCQLPGLAYSGFNPATIEKQNCLDSQQVNNPVRSRIGII